MRWAGFLRPQYAEEYTFFARVSGDADRVKLWVDNSLLVDQWLSLSATERSGTLTIGAANAYFDVAMEYKHVEGSYDQGATLAWQSASVAKAAIDIDRLVATADFLDGAYPLVAVAAPQCASTSVVSGLGLSFWTAGVAVAFTLSSRDAYANTREAASLFSLNLTPTGAGVIPKP